MTKYDPKHPDCHSAWLRIEFAKAALTGLLASGPVRGWDDDDFAQAAFRLADAMLVISREPSE